MLKIYYIANDFMKSIRSNVCLGTTIILIYKFHDIVFDFLLRGITTLKQMQQPPKIEIRRLCFYTWCTTCLPTELFTPNCVMFLLSFHSYTTLVYHIFSSKFVDILRCSIKSLKIFQIIFRSSVLNKYSTFEV